MDTLYPILRLQEDGFRPVVAGPQKRRYQMVLHEIPQTGWEITREYEGYTIQADVAFAEVQPEAYVGIFFSGGRAPEYIRYDPDLVRITRYFSSTASQWPLSARRGNPGVCGCRGGAHNGVCPQVQV